MPKNKRKKTSLEKLGLIFISIYVFGFSVGVVASHTLGYIGWIFFAASLIFYTILVFKYYGDIYDTLTDNP